MIVESTPFDPDVDKNPVTTSGFLELQTAWINGAVPSDMTSTVESFNGIDNPSDIAGKPRDFADAFRMNKEYSKALESDNGNNTDKSQ